jgi:ketosteroid isomerase-like protein
MIERDLPEVKAEVEAAFAAYEKALVANDVAMLGSLFLDHPDTIRFGIGENLHGYDEIQAFRAARPSAGLSRTLSRTVISTFGRDMAVASTLFHRPSLPGMVGRQQQTWVRTDDGWKVAAAHVSVIPDQTEAR